MSSSYGNKSNGKVQYIDVENYNVKKSDNGKIFILNRVGGSNIVLPEVLDGMNFMFIVGTANTGDTEISASQNIKGSVMSMGSPVYAVYSEDAAIYFYGTLASVGDYITVHADVGNNEWKLTGMCAVNSGIET